MVGLSVTVTAGVCGLVGVLAGVFVIVDVDVAVRVLVGVGVRVAVGVRVNVAVDVEVQVVVAVAVAVPVLVGVGVRVAGSRISIGLPPFVQSMKIPCLLPPLWTRSAQALAGGGPPSRPEN